MQRSRTPTAQDLWDAWLKTKNSTYAKNSHETVNIQMISLFLYELLFICCEDPKYIIK